MTTMPPIVCLCGSTRFKETFDHIAALEKAAGKIVLGVTIFGHSVPEHAALLVDDMKARIDEIHLRQIDLADEVLILNVGGYVGESTRREIAYARSRGKPIRWLEPPPPQDTQADTAPDPADGHDDAGVSGVPGRSERVTNRSSDYQAIPGPTDEQLIRHILFNPGCRLRDLCRLCYLPYQIDGRSTPEAKALAGQLRRLRRQGKLRTTQGQRWEVRTK